MGAWFQWLSVLLSLVAIEVMTGTRYFLMLAIGVFAGALAAIAGASLLVQILIAALVGVIAVVRLHKKKKSHST